MSKKVMTKDNLEMTVGINYYEHFYLTYNLIALLNQTQSRIVNVSSKGHESAGKIDFKNFNSQNNFTSFKIYSYFKLANILFT